jgi:Flp pilus assembly protein TadG
MAISLVILLYLLSGAVELGIIFFQYVQLRDAGQEGALYGSTHPQPADLSEIERRIRGSSNSPIDLTGATITISIDGTPSGTAAYATKDCEGHGLQVMVGYNHTVFMPFGTFLLGRSTIPLHATVTDTILRPYTC